jgi:hypothetical protein
MSIKTTPYGFIPTQVSGCVLWLDGADPAGTGVIPANGSSITTWTDKSGLGNNATGGVSPTFNTSGINNLGIVSFNGTNSYLNSADLFSNRSFSIFIIIRRQASISSQTGILAGTQFNVNINLHFVFRSSTNLALGFYANDLDYVSFTNYTGNPATEPAYLIQATYISGTRILYVNGNQVASDANTTNLSSHVGALIGQYNGTYYNGFIGEICILNGTPNSTSRQQIEAYLAQKWGLTSSLPVGHPGLTTTVYQSSYLKTAGPKRNIATMTPFYTAFSPRKITGCSHWFDATDSSTITLSSGSLTQWNDKSGNGRNLTAVSGYANATVSSAFQNGLNVFNFFGNGLYRTALGNVSYPLEVYIIVALKSLTTHVDVLGMGDTATDNFNSLTFSESAARRWHNGSSFGNRQTISTTDETSLSFLLIQWSIANGNYLLRRNGTQLIQASQTYSFNNSATAAFQIGFRHTNIDAANFSGYIGEIVVFNNQLGTTDRQNVESYLAQKWGLTASLPGGHLQLTQPAGAITSLSLVNSKFSLTPIPSYILKYTYTGSNQSFVVPNGVTSINVYMWGAGGGAGLGAGGGAGCYVQGILTVIPGETLTIVVGQGGGNKASSFGKTYGGGGSGGGLDNGRSDIVSSQGGGRSAIVRSTTDLVTAAAGGGGRGGRGGRGRLVTGEVGTGVATGGTQSAGGTNNGAIYSGGNANQDNSAGGGSGYYGGGGGNQDQAGGGGSCLTSNLSLLAGESTYGTESSNGVLAPQTSSPYYNSDVAFGATASYGYNYGSGGNGLVVVSFSSKTSVSLTYSRLILLAWYGSVAYRYGLNVTTTVNNAFGGNPSNTITLSLATFTDPQVGTTKYTFIVYMFNGIQKFSSAYAEGTVLTFSSLT